MVIHTFGDSHCSNGWGGIPNLETHHLGPKLCFSIGRDGINIKDGYDVKNGDTVIFCFGEIDCRFHIHRHITEDRNYKEVIDDIVNKYFIKVKDAVDMFENLQTVIYNVVPPVKKEDVYQYPDHPHLGTDEERKGYVLYFNEKLKEKCIEYGFVFFDIYNKYIDSDGFLNKSLSDGTVHVGHGIFLRYFIDNNLAESL